MNGAVSDMGALQKRGAGDAWIWSSVFTDKGLPSQQPLQASNKRSVR